MKVLIDSDTVAFAAAASCEDHPEPFNACARAHASIENIIQVVGADSYELWLTGKNNFRYAIYPEYKGNRQGAYRPKWEKAVKEYLAIEWDANWAEGCEADDMVGVRQMEEQDTIIAHIDKDIDMIPGRHYGWDIVRLGKIVKAARFYDITEEEALRKFYTQLLVGDSTDNIKGAAGVGPVGAKKLLQGCTTEQEMFQACLDNYGHYDEMVMNARCLWIWRKRNDDVTERWVDWKVDELD